MNDALELIRRAAVRPDRESPGAYPVVHCGLRERSGSLALLEGAEWLDRMYGQSQPSILARRPWLQAWADSFPGWEPWLLALVDGDRVRAVAPLARRRVRAGVQVVSLGDDELTESPLAAAGDRAAQQLAGGIVRALRSLGQPWMLCLRQLPVGSAVAQALTAELATTVVFPGSPGRCCVSPMTSLLGGG